MRMLNHTALVQFIEQAITRGGKAATTKSTHQRNGVPLPFHLSSIVMKLRSTTMPRLRLTIKPNFYGGTAVLATYLFRLSSACQERRGSKATHQSQASTMRRMPLLQDDKGSMANEIKGRQPSAQGNPFRRVRVRRSIAINSSRHLCTAQRQAHNQAIHCSNNLCRPFFKASLHSSDDKHDFRGDGSSQEGI